MGYVLRVRMASFFGGAAVASFLGLYILHNDYKVAHHSISQQVRFPFSFLQFLGFYLFFFFFCFLWVLFSLLIWEPSNLRVMTEY